jgi:putative acetyltransferase
MQIRAEAPDQPDVLALIDELDAYQVPLYPIESHHGVDIETLKRPDVAFAVVRDEAGRAQACGGVQVGPQFAELKRMYVRPACRGRGLGKALLQWLEAAARERGSARLMLETGIHQHEALALYERMGFRRRGPFGGYAQDPMSVFMEKTLG